VTVTKIAFLGMGRMGVPMAGRLVDAGHDVTVWNRTPEKAEPVVRRGARQAATPAEAATGAEVAITMVADPTALRSVVGGADGLAAGLGSGSYHLEMSTVGPETVRELPGLLPAGVILVDAPVLGSIPQANEGTLKIFVGGTEEAFEEARPLLETLGSPRRLGELGAGAAMKLVANSTLGALMTGLGEALALGVGLGLEPGDMLEILSDSAIGVTARSKRSFIEGGRYEPANFTVALATKDMGLVAAAAEENGVRLRLAPAARAWFEAALEAGLGDLDYSAVISAILDRSGEGR